MHTHALKRRQKAHDKDDLQSRLIKIGVYISYA